MRVAVVAGPDPGHAFPAIALCLRFLAAGDAPTLLTGTEWLDTARSVGVDAVELVGLDPTEVDDDADAGAKIHRRAARMAVLNAPRLRDLAPDLVVSDVITTCGGLAAELLGAAVGRAEARIRCTGRRRGCRRWAAGWRRVSGCAVGCVTAVMRALTARSVARRVCASAPRHGSRSACPHSIPARCGG